MTNRPVLVDAQVLDALAHPVRLDVLGYLMSDGPATASVCARAVGDSPSNCSYHLRVLARHGLVRPEESKDGRERPWRATITGFSLADADADADAAADADADAADDDTAERAAKRAAAVLAAALQLDQRLSREYLAARRQVPKPWRAADAFATYTLRVTPAELQSLVQRLDDLIRPLLAATRADAPSGAESVHLSLQAFPRARPR